MSVKKRQKRIKETNDEYEEAVQNNAAQEQVRGLADDVLFSIDTGGSKSAKRKIASMLSNSGVTDKMNVKGVVSRTEQLLVKRILENKKGVSSSSNINIGSSNSSKSLKGKLGDLWGNDDFAASRNSSSAKSNKTLVTKIRPGQSYNPSFVDHQEALAEALALEIKDKEKRERVIDGFDKIPAAASVFDEEDSEDNESSDDSDSDVDGEVSKTSARKKKKAAERLTTAQKNKKKAQKLARYIKALEKKEKSLLKDVSRIPQLNRDIERAEASAEARRELEALRKEQKEATESYNELIAFESGLTPLTDELRGSLRTVIPKGSALSTQVNLLKSGGKVLKANRKRKHHEKPHGAKRQVWIPKQKFHLIK